MTATAEWILFEGLIAIKRVSKRGKITISYPDPMADDLVEAFVGQTNMLKQLGEIDDQQAVSRIIAFCDRLHGPEPRNPDPVKRAEFNPEDAIRAHGLGVDLNEDSL